METANNCSLTIIRDEDYSAWQAFLLIDLNRSLNLYKPQITFNFLAHFVHVPFSIGFYLILRGKDYCIMIKTASWFFPIVLVLESPVERCYYFLVEIAFKRLNLMK